MTKIAIYKNFGKQLYKLINTYDSTIIIYDVT